MFFVLIVLMKKIDRLHVIVVAIYNSAITVEAIKLALCDSYKKKKTYFQLILTQNHF
jgi:hypothetical protein